jgi:prepilin-type N-terminal cleavage/methylation domain-containing protein
VDCSQFTRRLGMDTFIQGMPGSTRRIHRIRIPAGLGLPEQAPGVAGKARGWREFVPRNRGFTLFEVMASTAILLVIAASTFSVISSYQKTYVTTQLKADMFQNMLGVTGLMGQEIGQAGLVSLPSSPVPQLTATVTSSATAQTKTVSSAVSMYVGEKLLFDTGIFQELVTLTAVNAGANQIAGVFVNNHASGAAINVGGVFFNGVMTSSTPTQMRVFGDINADGSLVYVHYDCDTVAGTLRRSVTTVTPTATASNPSQILLNTLLPGSGSGCFLYTISPPVNGYTFVTSVAVTLSIRTSSVDPVTHSYLTMAKSFMNLTPRNVLGGMELANAQFTDRLQPTPPNLPLP